MRRFVGVTNNQRFALPSCEVRRPPRRRSGRGRRGEAAPGEGDGQPTNLAAAINARRSAFSTLAWRFAPVLSRFAGEGIRDGLGVTKEFGFRPKSLKSLGSWNTFALLRLSLALLRLSGPLAEVSLAWIVVQRGVGSMAFRRPSRRFERPSRELRAVRADGYRPFPVERIAAPTSIRSLEARPSRGRPRPVAVPADALPLELSCPMRRRRRGGQFRR